MKLSVNGDIRECEPGQSVRDLLIALGLDKPGVAVEVNRTLIPRKAHETTTLGEGDRVEIVTLVGGG